MNNFGFESVLESPSVSKASISNFKSPALVSLKIPRPDVPVIKKSVALLLPFPRARSAAEVPIPPRIDSVAPLAVVLDLANPNLVPSLEENDGDTSTKKASIST